MKNRKELISRFAYASGDIYGGGSFIIVGLLLLVYLTNVEGFSGTHAGIIAFIGKAWDAITDPFMGQLSDRTRSRFGRRRIYFLLGRPSRFRLLGNVVVRFWYHRDHG